MSMLLRDVLADSGCIRVNFLADRGVVWGDKWPSHVASNRANGPTSTLYHLRTIAVDRLPIRVDLKSQSVSVKDALGIGLKHASLGAIDRIIHRVPRLID